MKSLTRRRRGVFVLFTVPAVALFFWLTLLPFIELFWYSFTNWNGIAPTYKMIGFDNFTKLLKDPKIWNGLRINLIFTFVGGIATYVLAFFNSSILCQSKLGGRKLYQTLLFLPNVMSSVIVSTVWFFIYNPNTGILNDLLAAVGLEAWQQLWLNDKKLVVYCLTVVWVWASQGFYMVLISSAIEAVPHDYIEAAAIDGANGWQSFWRITVPLIKETIKTSLVFFFINSFSGVYTYVDVMTKGGPAGASEVMTFYLYKMAFKQAKYGYGAAISVFVFVVIMVVCGIMLLLTRRKDEIEY